MASRTYEALANSARPSMYFGLDGERGGLLVGLPSDFEGETTFVIAVIAVLAPGAGTTVVVVAGTRGVYAPLARSFVIRALGLLSRGVLLFSWLSLWLGSGLRTLCSCFERRTYCRGLPYSPPTPAS